MKLRHRLSEKIVEMKISTKHAESYYDVPVIVDEDNRAHGCMDIAFLQFEIVDIKPEELLELRRMPYHHLLIRDHDDDTTAIGAWRAYGRALHQRNWNEAQRWLAVAKEREDQELAKELSDRKHPVRQKGVAP